MLAQVETVDCFRHGDVVSLAGDDGGCRIRPIILQLPFAGVTQQVLKFEDQHSTL